MKVASVLVALLVSATLVAALPPSASGQARMYAQVCRDIKFADLGAYGNSADPVGCGRNFPASVPYLILFVNIEGVDSAFVFNWELVDPSGEVYASYRVNVNPTGGTRWTYNIWDVLAVAATGKEIVERNPRLGRNLIEVGAIPVSQKPGEWTLKARMTPGSTTTYKFTLVQ